MRQSLAFCRDIGITVINADVRIIAAPDVTVRGILEHSGEATPA